MSTVATHCSPESMLQLRCAAHYPKIPGACKSVIPSKTRDLDWKLAPYIRSLTITAAAPDEG